MPSGPAVANLPTENQLSNLHSLYAGGRHLDAFELCRELAPLTEWREVAALLLGGRLAYQWGDDPLGKRLHLRAYRLDPARDDTTFYYSQNLWSKHGPFEALKFVRTRTRQLPDIPATPHQAYLWLQHGRLLGVYRDFTAGEPMVERAVAAFPQDPWMWVDKADFLESQDLYEEALAATDESLRIRPWYRPAVTNRAHLLQLLDRNEEAIAGLRVALDQIESGAAVRMLIGILEEQERLDELPPLLDLAEKYLPMADAADRRWLAGRRATAAYRRGDWEQAQLWARKNGTAYFTRLADRIANAKAPGPRVLLPVGFVRQHHMTCAPATLAALSNFWGVPADHAEIARLICYDGSLDHAERDWAETHGWGVREFRPTWETTCQLLDLGCPFAFVTVETESAHMQAVIGYDAVAGTLLVRDPYHRYYRDWAASEFFEAYAAYGPRAILIMPPEKAAMVDELGLADVGLYDHLYRLRRALFRHERSAADACFSDLRQRDEAH
ncbi:MAG TPA: C39 family peptidase, partial [Candidatus Didemnitutus sp.]|nr:C39 family peptidase [Candidatus Didemnitutus sp.]